MKVMPLGMEGVRSNTGGRDQRMYAELGMLLILVLMRVLPKLLWTALLVVLAWLLDLLPAAVLGRALPGAAPIPTTTHLESVAAR